MGSIPAICKICGKQFHSGRSIDPGIDFISIGGTAGPCPYCGGDGKIADGIYRFLNEVLDGIYSEDKVTLFRLKDVLEKSNSLSDEHEIMLMKEELNKSNSYQIEQSKMLKDILDKVESLQDQKEQKFQFKLFKVILGIAIPLLFSFADDSIEEFKNKVTEKFFEIVEFETD